MLQKRKEWYGRLVQACMHVHTLHTQLIVSSMLSILHSIVHYSFQALPPLPSSSASLVQHMITSLSEPNSAARTGGLQGWHHTRFAAGEAR
jgi:hypothetical protein